MTVPTLAQVQPRPMHTGQRFVAVGIPDQRWSALQILTFVGSISGEIEAEFPNREPPPTI